MNPIFANSIYRFRYVYFISFYYYPKGTVEMSLVLHNGKHGGSVDTIGFIKVRLFRGHWRLRPSLWLFAQPPGIFLPVIHQRVQILVHGT